MTLDRTTLSLLENTLAVIAKPTGVSAYDFDFTLHFDCRHPYRLDEEVAGILRVGAPADYTACFDDAIAMGVRPLNDPAQHRIASEIEYWYPLIAEATPKTEIFDVLPEAGDVERTFGWPVFLKGSRQTSKHNPDLAVIRDPAHYAHAREAYRQDPILHWQKPVLREFIPLMPVAGSIAGKIAPSMEFRTFWLDGACMGYGPYWYQIKPYSIGNIDEGLALAAWVAARVPTPFLVVDIALSADGRWIVIECNDAQESGHAGIAPMRLWRNVLDAFRNTHGALRRAEQGP